MVALFSEVSFKKLCVVPANFLFENAGLRNKVHQNLGGLQLKTTCLFFCVAIIFIDDVAMLSWNVP